MNSGRISSDHNMIDLRNITFGSYHHRGYFGGMVRADFQEHLDWLRSIRR